MKESFVLYTDMDEQLGMLDNEEAGKLMKAIFSYMRCGKPDVELTGATKMAFLFIRKTLDRDGEKYEQVKEGRSRAGRASAEARKRKKEETEQAAQAQRETAAASVPAKGTNASTEEQKGTGENSAEQRGTNSTVSVPVSVPDPVSVSVSDPVPAPVPEKQKKAFGRYQNIFLAQEELMELQREFPVDYMDRLERLSEYMASTGKRYASPLAAIRYWAKNGKEKPNGKLKQPDPGYGWQFGTVL